MNKWEEKFAAEDRRNAKREDQTAAAAAFSEVTRRAEGARSVYMKSRIKEFGILKPGAMVLAEGVFDRSGVGPLFFHPLIPRTPVFQVDTDEKLFVYVHPPTLGMTWNISHARGSQDRKLMLSFQPPPNWNAIRVNTIDPLTGTPIAIPEADWNLYFNPKPLMHELFQLAIQYAQLKSILRGN